MLGNIGPSGLILILVALLLVFGPRKLPEIGKGFGKGLREFRRAMSGLKDSDLKDNDEEKSSSSTNEPQAAETVEQKESVQGNLMPKNPVQGKRD